MNLVDVLIYPMLVDDLIYPMLFDSCLVYDDHIDKLQDRFF